ncbi:MAG: SEC-C metal-binding domain-containing protein, partial [Chloroflexota bacterium]|nr:SEC-C metal-binding domain-containing protein [Chloroflexota bacterium]
MTKKVGRNDPCPCGSGKKYKKCCGATGAGVPLPDRRLMERHIRGLAGAFDRGEVGSVEEARTLLSTSPDRLKWRPDTNLEKAQELTYQALEAPKRGDKIRLAMHALELSKDCADAYVLLAEESAETVEQSLNLYRRGMEAGERALGPEVFKEGVGHFWGIVETRPYMRAREGVAGCLRELGDLENAMGHYLELLRLNPNDNQGVRYKLLACLLEADRLEEAEKLLGKYKEDAAAGWLFGRALLHFRRFGNCQAARDALRDAIEANRHVPAYLTEQRPMPTEYPEYVTFGESSEAVEYVLDFREAWMRTPGALDWLRAEAQAVERASEKIRPWDAQASKWATTAVPVRKAEEGLEPTSEEWARLYQAAVAFRDLAPWRWMEDDGLFGVTDPETGVVGYCCIMGALGEAFALGLFPGSEGLASFLRLATGQVEQGDFEAITSQRCLLASFEDRRALDKRDLQIIKGLGLQFRGRGA